MNPHTCSVLAPKASASANFATSAYVKYCGFFRKNQIVGVGEGVVIGAVGGVLSVAGGVTSGEGVGEGVGFATLGLG